MSNSLNIKNYEEFMALSNEDRKKVLGEELLNRSVSFLAKEWGCKDGNLYDARRKLGLPGSTKEVLAPKKKKAKSEAAPEPQKRPYNKKVVTEEKANSAPVVPVAPVPAFIPKPKPNYVFQFQIPAFDSPEFEAPCIELRGDEVLEHIMQAAEIVNKNKDYMVYIDIKQLRETKPREKTEPVKNEGEA